MSLCRSCQQPIRWARTDRGKPMPLDPEPSKGGNITLVGDGQYDIAYVLGPVDTFEQDELDADLYTSHFATCPQASQWRSGQ